MPDEKWIIADTYTDLFLKTYAISLSSCQWDTENNALQFDTQEAANTKIESWEETAGERFIGQHPHAH